MPIQRGKTILKKGQSLEDIVNALIGAESDIAGRSNVPSKQHRLIPGGVEPPDFNRILAGMGSQEPFWQPGMHWDPNASKGHKVMQAITSLMGSVDPEYSGMMMKRNQFIAMNRKND